MHAPVPARLYSPRSDILTDAIARCDLWLRSHTASSSRHWDRPLYPIGLATRRDSRSRCLSRSSHMPRMATSKPGKIAHPHRVYSLTRCGHTGPRQPTRPRHLMSAGSFRHILPPATTDTFERRMQAGDCMGCTGSLSACRAALQLTWTGSDRAAGVDLARARKKLFLTLSVVGPGCCHTDTLTF